MLGRMRYLGGKAKIGKKIAGVLLSNTTARGSYYEPFLGGGEAFRHIAPHFDRTFAGDAHEDLMLMWSALASGWVPPDVNEATYRSLRDEKPSAPRGFAGFGCSFGGKWWGGFARGEDRDYGDESRRNVLKIAALMKNTTLRRCSFDEWDPEPGSVVYADPPYKGTTGYAGGFDHDMFWSVARGWAVRGAIVFVSEYQAPSGWRELWKHEHRRFVSKVTRDVTVERLFVLG